MMVGATDVGYTGLKSLGMMVVVVDYVLVGATQLLVVVVVIVVELVVADELVLTTIGLRATKSMDWGLTDDTVVVLVVVFAYCEISVAGIDGETVTGFALLQMAETVVVPFTVVGATLIGVMGFTEVSCEGLDALTLWGATPTRPTGSTCVYPALFFPTRRAVNNPANASNPIRANTQGVQQDLDYLATGGGGALLAKLLELTLYPSLTVSTIGLEKLLV